MLASVEAQVRRDVEPALTLAGFAVRLSVGAGAVTATATSREIVPPSTDVAYWRRVVRMAALSS